MTKLEFAEKATPLTVTAEAQPRLSKGGSCCWTKRQTISVRVDGIEYRGLMTVQVTIPRSKKWATH